MPYPKGVHGGVGHWNRGVSFGPKVRKLKKIEVAYVAGLFDGEGSIINTHKARGNFCLKIVVGMCNEEVINYLRDLTGCGSITVRKQKNPKHSTCYVWSCYGANAAALLEQMLPWLIVKREKAIEMIAEYTFTIDPS